MKCANRENERIGETCLISPCIPVGQPWDLMAVILTGQVL